MSSSFWSSSHCLHWQTTRPSIWNSRQVDLQYCTSKQLYCLHIFLIQLIQKLGKRLLLRQIPIATACVFFKRFYLKNSLCESNPYLVLAACVFVAAKVEETPVHIKSVVSEAKVVFSEYNIKLFPAEANKLGEMEFYLLEDLDFHLVIFHPYRALLHITGREPADSGKFPLSRIEEDQLMKKKDMDSKKKRDDEIRKLNLISGKPSPSLSGNGISLSSKDTSEVDEVAAEAKRIRRLMSRGSTEGIGEVDEGVLQISWFILNDTYRTDVHLLYPPYIIAISAVYIAFCLTSMNQSSRSRNSSSSQVNNLASSTQINESLNLESPPTNASDFLAGFQINLTILFACVQDIVSLYAIWESFEPTSIRTQTQNQSQQTHVKALAGIGGASNTTAGANAGEEKKDKEKEKEKFGPEQAELLIRKMIESRLIDMGHPNNAGSLQTLKRSNLNNNGIDNSSTTTSSGVGKKRARK